MTNESNNQVVQLIEQNKSVFAFDEEKTGEENILDFLNKQIAEYQERQKHLLPRTLNEVVVKITPAGFPTIEFLFAKQLKKAQFETKQAWLGMTEEEEKTKIHEFRVRTLAQLLRCEPLNVPNWNESDKEQSLSEKFVAYFLDEENETFVGQLDVLYANKILPGEFFVSRSES